ncbi:MAG: hypothetical protein ACFCUO_09945, partial [Rhodospirillales bacterium]
SFRRPLPPLTGAILGRIDGRRTLREVYAAIAASGSNVSRETFAAEFKAMFCAFNGLGKMYLRIARR